MEYQVRPEKSSTQEFIGLSYGVRCGETGESEPVRGPRRTFLPTVLLILCLVALVLVAVSDLGGRRSDGAAGFPLGNDDRVSPWTDRSWSPVAEGRTAVFVCAEVGERVRCLIVDAAEPSLPAAADSMGVPFRDTDPSMSIPMEGNDPRIVTTPTSPRQFPAGSV